SQEAEEDCREEGDDQHRDQAVGHAGGDARDGKPDVADGLALQDPGQESDLVLAPQRLRRVIWLPGEHLLPLRAAEAVAAWQLGGGGEVAAVGEVEPDLDVAAAADLVQQGAYGLGYQQGAGRAVVVGFDQTDGVDNRAVHVAGHPGLDVVAAGESALQVRPGTELAPVSAEAALRIVGVAPQLEYFAAVRQHHADPQAEQVGVAAQHREQQVFEAVTILGLDRGGQAGGSAQEPQHDQLGSAEGGDPLGDGVVLADEDGVGLGGGPAGQLEGRDPGEGGTRQ